MPNWRGIIAALKGDKGTWPARLPVSSGPAGKSRCSMLELDLRNIGMRISSRGMVEKTDSGSVRKGRFQANKDGLFYWSGVEREDL